MINFYKILANPSKLFYHDEYSELLTALSYRHQYHQSEYNLNDFTSIRHIIKRSPGFAYYHALDKIKGRFREAEPYIISDVVVATFYAIHIMKERWVDAEPNIQTNDRMWDRYTAEFKMQG